MQLPTSIAHAVWFVDGGSPADWHVFFQAQTLGLLAVALAIVAGVRVAAARWPGVDLPALAKLVDWMPLVVRLHLAGALIMQPALGFFITPSLPLPAGALGGLFAALMVVPAVLLIVGWNMRLAAGLVIATLPVAAMHYGAWAALGRADIVGAAAFCAILGAGPWSLERRLSGPRPRSFDAHLRAMWCLRMALGLALLIAAFAEKLAHPDIALTFLADHGDFNVAAMIGLPVSDLEFTRVVGVIEIMTALLVMSGAMPQVILPFTIMPFIATLLQLGDVELAGHFSAHGALIATVVYASHPQLRRTVYHLWPWPPVGGRSARRVAPATDPVAATAAAR